MSLTFTDFSGKFFCVHGNLAYEVPTIFERRITKMSFMNDNDFMLELTDEELNEINGSGDGFVTGCDGCGIPAFPSIPSCTTCGCSTCGFATIPFVFAFSNEMTHLVSFNVSFNAATIKKTSIFVLKG